MGLACIKRLLPRSWRNAIHFFYAWLGSIKYHHPSEELFVIGVTGTSGKSSTIYFLRQILEAAGFKVGALSTIEFCIAGKCRLNDRKMTMLGRFEIQRYLRQMADSDCRVAIIETTSEGALQRRHRFINYDFMVLTNLYPEHIEAHGSFANYKKAKLDLFHYAARCQRKPGLKWLGHDAGKTAIVNAQTEHVNDFLHDNFDKKITFRATEVSARADGVYFQVEGQTFRAPIHGEHNAANLAAAITAAHELKIEWPVIQKAVNDIKCVPGRIEFIPEAEKHGFKVIVDYAFEPVAMSALYEVVRGFRPKRILHVFGSTGGGRDKARRFTVGKFVGERADICIVTNEDPYDDDPMAIINDLVSAVTKEGKKDGVNLFRILDRGEAIKIAINLAQTGDIVLITGKGSEQAMVIKDSLIPWDDREEVRKVLRKRESGG